MTQPSGYRRDLRHQAYSVESVTNCQSCKRLDLPLPDLSLYRDGKELRQGKGSAGSEGAGTV